MCIPQWTQFQTSLPTCMYNTSRSERNQLCIPNTHQTMHFNVCMLLVWYNLFRGLPFIMLPKWINSLATQQPSAKYTRPSLLKWPNSKRGRTNQTSSNQIHEPSTHGSSRHHQAAATPSRSTTLDSPPLTQLQIPLPSDSAQNHGTFVPHEVFNQLSNALQHLTSSMQANNTPTPGNAKSTLAIEDGTPNDETLFTIENSTPKCRLHGCLTRGLRTTATWYFLWFYTYRSFYPYGPYCITWSPPRCVTNTGTLKDERECNLWQVYSISYFVTKGHVLRKHWARNL